MNNLWGKINDENIAITTEEFKIYKKTFTWTYYQNYSDVPCITTLKVPKGAKIHFPENNDREFLENAKIEEIRGKIRVDSAIVESNICSPWIGFTTYFKNYFPRTMEKLKKSETFAGEPVESVYSMWDTYFKYSVNRTVKPYNGFRGKNVDCAEGIHGFFNKSDAESYY